MRFFGFALVLLGGRVGIAAAAPTEFSVAGTYQVGTLVDEKHTTISLLTDNDPSDPGKPPTCRVLSTPGLSFKMTQPVKALCLFFTVNNCDGEPIDTLTYPEGGTFPAGKHPRAYRCYPSEPSERIKKGRRSAEELPRAVKVECAGQAYLEDRKTNNGVQELVSQQGCVHFTSLAQGVWVDPDHTCTFYATGCKASQRITRLDGGSYSYLTPHASAYECMRKHR